MTMTRTQDPTPRQERKALRDRIARAARFGGCSQSTQRELAEIKVSIGRADETDLDEIAYRLWQLGV